MDSILKKINKIKNRSLKFYKKGFTLAETIITFGAVGVIVAFVFPIVLARTELNEFTAQLKKAESILRQSMYQISLRTGYPPGDYGIFYDSDFIDEFSKVVNVTKFCNTAAECFGNFSENYVKLDQTPFSEESGKAARTADGMLFTYLDTPPSEIHGLTEEDMEKTIGRVIVDVNGPRKPNRIGLDTHMFYIVKEKGIVPAGAGVNTDCHSRKESGFCCTARVLSENEIKY